MKYLKIPTLQAGQWYDKDIIMLHAAFQLLVDFVEQERPDEICDWQYDEPSRHAWSEIQALYDWWTEERPARRDPCDDVAAPPCEEYVFNDDGSVTLPDRGKYAEYYAAVAKSHELEEEWHQEDQRNLHRLVEIRPHLWV